MPRVRHVEMRLVPFVHRTTWFRAAELIIEEYLHVGLSDVDAHARRPVEGKLLLGAAVVVALSLVAMDNMKPQRIWIEPAASYRINSAWPICEVRATS